MGSEEMEMSEPRHLGGRLCLEQYSPGTLSALVLGCNNQEV